MVSRELVEKRQVDWRALGREKFLERVWAWKEQYGSRILGQLTPPGCSCDWSREHFTMDAGRSRAVMTVFKRLFEGADLSRRLPRQLGSRKLQTAVSDLEVE